MSQFFASGEQSIGILDVYNLIPLLYTWNIVRQLYFN